MCECACCGFVWTRPPAGRAVRANSDCHVSLCLPLQEKVAVVTKLKDKCVLSSTARSVTVAEIAEGAACCEPPHPVTAALFCDAMCWLADGGGRAASRKIASAGGIPVIVQLLACLLDEEQVVKNAFWALIALSPLSDELAKAALPTIIANVRVHATMTGYEFLAKHVHLPAAFYECEGGAEVYDILVSCSVRLSLDACGAS